MSGRAIRTLRHDPNTQPFIVIWEVTRACGLVCAHCRANAQHDRNPFELTTEEGRRLLDDLAMFGPPRPLVVLTGGDPFEREDLAELVAHGTDRGLSMALSPSVTDRLTRAALDELRRAGARAVSLSLDGATAATHDAFRGVDGVFDATLAAAAEVTDAGLRLQINTTVTAGNVHELPGILRQVVTLGAGLWSVFFLVPTGRGDQLKSLDADATEQVLIWLHEVARLVAVKTTEAPQFRRIALHRAHVSSHRSNQPAGPLHAQLRAATQASGVDDIARERHAARPPLDVNAGRGFVFVDHLGVVYPSGFLPVPVGSVRSRSITEIYRDAPMLRMLRDPEALGGRCGACEFRTVCGGSRSRAFAVHGDLLAEDPSCPYAPAATGPPSGVSGLTTPAGSV